MTVTFYLEIIDGDKHTWVNHSVTKAEEIDWLLKKVRGVLEQAFVTKGNPKSNFFKSLLGGNKSSVAPDVTTKQNFRNRMGDL